MTDHSYPLIVEFVAESNRIENIVRPPHGYEVRAHKTFFGISSPTVSDLEIFVDDVCGKSIRDGAGMDVRVGSHIAPPGGPAIVEDLTELLGRIVRDSIAPHPAHCEYETLHPFMDGNGRSGRVLWAWQMLRFDHVFGIELGFLRAFITKRFQVTGHD